MIRRHAVSFLRRRLAFPKEQHDATDVTFDRAVAQHRERLEQLQRDVDDAVAAYQDALQGE